MTSFNSGTIEHIIGRELECEELREAYALVETQSMKKVVFLSGASGVGKTALLSAFGASLKLDARLVLNASMKKDEQKHPYSMLKRAFTPLIQTLANDHEESFKQLLLSEKDNLAFLTEFTGHIANAGGLSQDDGKTPVVGAVAAASGGRVRFVNAMLSFIAQVQKLPLFQSTSASLSTPVVLLLDNAQWVDEESLNLLKAIISSNDAQRIFIALSFRDSKLNEDHPLTRFMTEVTLEISNNCHISSMALAPLTSSQTWELFAKRSSIDTAVIEKARATLKAPLQQKVSGNPAALVDLIGDMLSNGCIESVDGEPSKLDIESSLAFFTQEDTGSFSQNRIARLSPDARQVLCMFACYAEQASEQTISLLTEKPVEEVTLHLQEAEKVGVVKKQMGCWSFTAERFQEMAYRVDLGISKPKLHLNIGRTILKKWSEEQIESECFNVASQFNRALNLLHGNDEISLVRSLNYRIGIKAKKSTAYSAACYYFNIAADLVMPQDWENDYQDVFDLYLNLCECEYLVGNYDNADLISSFISEHASKSYDRANVYRLRLAIDQLSGKLEKAITEGLKGLALLDYHFPESEAELETLCNEEKLAIKDKMSNKEVKELYDSPVISDKDIIAAVNLMVDLGPSMAIVRPRSNLYVLIVLKIIHITLVHGNTPSACFIFSQYGRRLITHGNNVKDGFAFAELATDLNKKFADKGREGQLTFFNGAYIQHWQREIQEGIELLESAKNACKSVGNFVFAGHSAFFKLMHVGFQERSVEDVLHCAREQTVLAESVHNKVLKSAISLFSSSTEAFSLVTQVREKPASLSISHANEKQVEHDSEKEKHLKVLNRANFAPAIGGCKVQQLAFNVVMGQHSKANELGNDLLAVLAPGGLAEINYYYYYALNSIVLYRNQQSRFNSIKELTDALAPMLDKVHFAANCAPENFSHQYFLLQAELWRLKKSKIDAQSFYKKAIEAATANGFNLSMGLACERAAEFHDEQGHESEKVQCLLDAFEAYRRFGASAKCAVMQQTYSNWIRDEQLSMQVG